MDICAGSVVEWIAGLKDNVQKLTAEEECSMELVLCAGASLLQEFCVLNWLGPAERDAASVRFGWKVERAEWVRTCHQWKCNQGGLWLKSNIYDTIYDIAQLWHVWHVYDTCDMYDSVCACVTVAWCVYWLQTVLILRTNWTRSCWKSCHWRERCVAISLTTLPSALGLWSPPVVSIHRDSTLLHGSPYSF